MNERELSLRLGHYGYLVTFVALLLLYVSNDTQWTYRIASRSWLFANRSFSDDMFLGTSVMMVTWVGLTVRYSIAELFVNGTNIFDGIMTPFWVDNGDLVLEDSERINRSFVTVLIAILAYCAYELESCALELCRLNEDYRTQLIRNVRAMQALAVDEEVIEEGGGVE
jgi:hypothetical protein